MTPSSFFDVVYIVTKSIGDIPVAALTSETYTDTLTVTGHPVEFGVNIADHAYQENQKITMTCCWSNSEYRALDSSGTAGFDNFGVTTAAGYIDAVYSRLLQIQAARQPVKVVTSRRTYESVLLSELQVQVDDTTQNSALVVTATFTQIRVVRTKATTLPAREHQKNPSSTSEVVNMGAKQVTPTLPSPGGSVTPH